MNFLNECEREWECHWGVSEWPHIVPLSWPRFFTWGMVYISGKTSLVATPGPPWVRPPRQSWPKWPKKSQNWCGSLKTKIMQKWSRFWQKVSFLGLLDRENIKVGGGVGGHEGCPMGGRYGAQIGQISGPDGGGCKKWQKPKLLIFLENLHSN